MDRSSSEPGPDHRGGPLEDRAVAAADHLVGIVERKYARLLRLDSITCIVDAEAVFAHGDNAALSMLKMRQIGFADLVVLNKVDLVGREHVEVIKEWIDHHLNRVRIIEAVRCDVPLEILLAVGRFDPAQAVSRLEGEGDQHGHGELTDMFQRWSFESDRPLSLDALRHMVRKELPASVYRCKGIVYAADHPDKRLTLQIVGRRTEIYELDEWGERTPRTQIVAIGSPIDATALRQQFDACIAP